MPLCSYMHVNFQTLLKQSTSLNSKFYSNTNMFRLKQFMQFCTLNQKYYINDHRMVECTHHCCKRVGSQMCICMVNLTNMEIKYEDYIRSMNYSICKSLYAVQSLNLLTKSNVYWTVHHCNS